MERKEDFLTRIDILDDRGNKVGEADVISYKGLLALGHADGLRAVRTNVVQLPNAANGHLAVVRARVRTNKGTFSGVGDASPTNVSARIAGAIVRMAETRAIARALRVAVNVGEVTLEELAGDTAPSHTASTPRQSATAAPPRPASPQPNGKGQARSRGRDPNPEHADAGDRRAMSDDQRRLLFRLAYSFGLEGEAAAAKVREVLGVARLEHATRVDASRAIDVLKQAAPPRAANGNGHSHGQNGHAPGGGGHGSG